MWLTLFIKGFVMGLLIAVPVGPIGLLCINRALADGIASGLASGLGVATGDALAASIAVLGLSLTSTFLVAQEPWLRLIGGLFLSYLGVRTFLARPAEQAKSLRRDGLVGDYVSTFFLTITNPVTVTSFVAILAGFGFGGGLDSRVSTAVLLAGIFSGSAFWWILLSGGLLAFPTRFSYRGLRWVHRISGVIIAGFGIIVLFGIK